MEGLGNTLYNHERASHSKIREEHFREKTQLMQRPLPAWRGHSELGWYEGTAFITVVLSLLTNFKHILWGRPVLVSENTDK